MSRKDRMAELDTAIGGLASTRTNRLDSNRSPVPIVNQIESVFENSDAELDQLQREGRVLLDLDPQVVRTTRLQDRHATAFVDDAFEVLVQDILKRGQLVPILVRRAGKGEFEVIAGHRRLAACRRLGRKVLARAVEAADRDLLIQMVRENETREDI